jgi:hypothetical protein
VGRGAVAGVGDAPDAAALAVAARVGERHLVVADDAVVEVGDVERAVRRELDVDRPEPLVVAAEEVGLLLGLVAGAVFSSRSWFDPSRDGIADDTESRYFSGSWGPRSRRSRRSRSKPWRCCIMFGAWPRPVVLAAERRIPAAAEQLVDRQAVAVRRVQVAQRVEAEAERVHLAVGVVHHLRSVRLHAPRVAERIVIGAVVGRRL